MVDTNTVNFAIDKIAAGFHKVAPQIEHVGEKYVIFVVAKTILETGIYFLIIALLAYPYYRVIKSGYGEDCDWYNADKTEFMLPFIILSAIIPIAIICFFCCLYNTGLALVSPEMYTIHNILNSK